MARMVANDLSPGERVNVQLMHLLSGVSEHGDQHLAEVERDLVQMDILLGEAIKKLCASFLAMHQTVIRQQETLDSLMADNVAFAAQAERFSGLRAEIDQQVGAAVTGLQFQDMTSQLIGRMAQHLGGLREVFGELGGQGVTLRESGDAALLQSLDRICERVGARCSSATRLPRSAVNQRHMESGEIELF